jgi:hypothetical protein
MEYKLDNLQGKKLKFTPIRTCCTWLSTEDNHKREAYLCWVPKYHTHNINK